MFHEHLKPGEWYLTALCKHCNLLIVVFRDLNRGQAQIGGCYTIDCGRCRRVGTYDVVRYQHQERRRPELRIEIC